MQRFLDLFIFINCSTCFRRFLRPSPGAQNCIYSVRYCQTNTAAIMDEMECSSSSSTIAAGYRHTNTAAIMDEMELRSISSMIAADSSIVLTIPDAVYTGLCSWWWAEEPPETCRAICRNKLMENTLHLVGRTLEICLRCTDMWTSKIWREIDTKHVS